MISSGKINNKFIKMDNYKKQILQRVIDFYIEKADADKKTIKTVACLMNDIEAINYTRCCTEFADGKCRPMVNADWTYLRCECGKRFEPKV
jgi:hypothetical protein